MALMGLGKSFRPAPVETKTHDRWAGSGFAMVIDGQPVNDPLQVYGGGMSLPAAWRASLKISDALGSVPWDLWKVGQDRRTRKKRPGILEQPDPREQAMTTYSSWGLDLVWHGNAVGLYAGFDPDRKSVV